MDRDYITIRYGLEEVSNLEVRSPTIGSIVPINDREFMGIGVRDIFRFESSGIKEYYPYQLTSQIFIQEFRVILGITAINAEFIVLFVDDMRKPMYTGVKTHDPSIFNMVYAPKSSVIITAGEDIRTWNFRFIPPPKTVIYHEPVVEISLRSVIIHHCHSSIMNPPLLDTKSEKLFLDDGEGSLDSYTLSGLRIGSVLKFQTTDKSAVGFYQFTRKFLTSNSAQGALLWHKSGKVMKRYLLGSSASLAIRFINSEYAMILDATGRIMILDVKTGRGNSCYSAEKRVHRIFVFNHPFPQIIMCCGSHLITLKVVLPCRLWTTTVSKPMSIVRCNKFNEAARILVICSDSHMKLISPANSKTLTAVTLQSLSLPYDCFYDRGTQVQPEIKRDQVFVPLVDGTMQIFSTGVNPCEKVATLELKAVSICLCLYKGKLCFALGTITGHIIFLDYTNLKQVKRTIATPHPIIGLFYNQETDSLILIYEDTLYRIILNTEKVLDATRIRGNNVSIQFDGIVIFGYKTGQIGAACIRNGHLIEHETNGMRLHDAEITGFSLGSTFFVSSSLDRSIRIWSKDFMIRYKIILSIPLFSCGVLNGKRDILIGTESDILIVKGSTIFGDEIDPEYEPFDTYDRKADFLDDQTVEIEEEVSSEDEPQFLNSRKIEQEKPKEEKKQEPQKVNARRRMIAEALKKRQEEKAKEEAEGLKKIQELDTPKDEDKAKVVGMMTSIEERAKAAEERKRKLAEKKAELERQMAEQEANMENLNNESKKNNIEEKPKNVEKDVEEEEEEEDQVAEQENNEEEATIEEKEYEYEYSEEEELLPIEDEPQSMTQVGIKREPLPVQRSPVKNQPIQSRAPQLSQRPTKERNQVKQPPQKVTKPQEHKQAKEKVEKTPKQVKEKVEKVPKQVREKQEKEPKQVREKVEKEPPAKKGPRPKPVEKPKRQRLENSEKPVKEEEIISNEEEEVIMSDDEGKYGELVEETKEEEDEVTINIEQPKQTHEEEQPKTVKHKNPISNLKRIPSDRANLLASQIIAEMTGEAVQKKPKVSMQGRLQEIAVIPDERKVNREPIDHYEQSPMRYAPTLKYEKYVPKAIPNLRKGSPDVRQERRYPTPLGKKKRHFRFETERSSTPEIKGPIVSSCPVPYNIVFDLQTLESLAEKDSRYRHILEKIRRQNKILDKSTEIRIVLKIEQSENFHEKSDERPSIEDAKDMKIWRLRLNQIAIKNKKHIVLPDEVFTVSEPFVTPRAPYITQTVKFEDYEIPMPLPQRVDTRREHMLHFKNMMPQIIGPNRQAAVSARGISPFACRRYKMFIDTEQQAMPRVMGVRGKSLFPKDKTILPTIKRINIPKNAKSARK